MKCQDATWLLTTAGRRGNELPSKEAQTMSSCIWSCIKTATADADFCVSADISDLSISAAALALSTQKPMTKKDAASTMQVLDHPEGSGGRSRSCPTSLELDRSRTGWCPARGRWSCQAALEHGLHPMQLYLCAFVCWTGSQPNVLFPPSFGRADQGPGVEPWPCHCQGANSVCWQWRLAQDRDGQKIKTIFSPYILLIAHV